MLPFGHVAPLLQSGIMLNVSVAESKICGAVHSHGMQRGGIKALG